MDAREVIENIEEATKKLKDDMNLAQEELDEDPENKFDDDSLDPL